MDEKLTGKEKREVEALSKLLNVKCSRTGELIEVGEPVKCFDWGGDGAFLGYAKFLWDSSERRFWCCGDSDANQRAGIENFNGIEDNYDAFRAPVEKLTKAERKRLMN